MNAYPPASHTTANFSGAGASIGVQATEVHNSNIYQYNLDSSPQHKYNIGLKYLENNLPVKAEQLIDAAISGGHDGPEVRFHWVLALLSQRSYRGLSRHKRKRLDEFSIDMFAGPSNEYRNALWAIKEILNHLSGAGGDTSYAEKEILALPLALRSKIERHLALVISGATRDKLWQEAKSHAHDNRVKDDREHRVWAYFHPEPIGPRIWEAVPPQVTASHRNRAVGATLLFAASFGYLGWLTLTSGHPVSIVAYVAGVFAGWVGLRAASTWRYLKGRVLLEERRHHSYSAATSARGTGFANQVGRSFDRYFARYRPHDYEEAEWLYETAGIRGYLCKEIREVYRESRTPVGKVNWLIGYLAQDVRQRWYDNTLYEYCTRYRVDAATETQCVAGIAAMLAASTIVIDTAMRVSPILTPLLMVIAGASGAYSALRWQHIVSENRRWADDNFEAEQRHFARMRAFRRWKKKLHDTRPDEDEMAAWLQCDKTIGLDKALHHYGLHWSEVTSYAVLESPSAGTKSGRIENGPTRYARYDVRIFLITDDGVRDVKSVLDFEHGKFKSHERNNYRFDAVSSVGVVEGTNHSRTLKLTLMNGPTEKIKVTEDNHGGTQSPDAAAKLLQLNLDASGFTHTLRILEGIAAEGKGWIERDKTKSVR